MDKIRIGKDIKIVWELSATDERVILTQDELTLEMTTPTGCVAILPFTFDEEEGTLTSYFYGIDHKQLGRYWLTVWYKQDEIGQSALDKVLAFQLVRSTEEETHNDDSIAYAQVNLTGSIEIYGGGTGAGSTYTKEEIDEMVSTIDTSIINVSTSLSNHVTNTAIHVTLEDKTRWDSKQDTLTIDSSLDITSLNPVTNKAITTVIEENELVWAQALNRLNSSIGEVSTNLSNHASNSDIHVTAADKTRWDSKQDSGDYVTSSQLTAHTSDTSIHVTAADKASWNAKQDAGDYALRSELPTVGNATITIQKNGTSVDSFTTNASTNKSINITVPTTVASLTDSSDYFKKSEGGDVYGNTIFHNGIEGDLTGTIDGYSITNVTALPSNPDANTIYLITDN